MPDDRTPIVIEDETLRAGFTVIPNQILKRPDISPGAKLCYVMLLTYAWQEDSCFPGQVRLAEDMGVTDRSVRTYMKELEVAGLVVIKQRGLGQTNFYTLPKARPENISAQDRKESTGLDRKNFPTNKTQVNNQPERRRYIRKEERRKLTEQEELEKYRRSVEGIGMDLSKFESE